MNYKGVPLSYSQALYPLSELYPQYNGQGRDIQPGILYPAAAENLGALPVCVQKITLDYPVGVGIYAARN